MHLVDENERAVGVDSELVFGVGEDEPSVCSNLLTACKEAERSGFDLSPDIG